MSSIAPRGIDGHHDPPVLAFRQQLLDRQRQHEVARPLLSFAVDQDEPVAVAVEGEPDVQSFPLHGLPQQLEVVARRVDGPAEDTLASPQDLHPAAETFEYRWSVANSGAPVQVHSNGDPLGAPFACHLDYLPIVRRGLRGRHAPAHLRRQFPLPGSQNLVQLRL